MLFRSVVGLGAVVVMGLGTRLGTFLGLGTCMGSILGLGTRVGPVVGLESSAYGRLAS